MRIVLLASAALAYSAIRAGRYEAIDISLTGLLAGCAALAFWVRRQGRLKVPPCPPWIRWPLLMVCGYAVFQLVPLPLWLLDQISPARAGTVRAANAVLAVPVGWAPLNLVPAAGLQHVIVIASCVALVFLVRELAWEHGPWPLVAPVIVIGLAEAIFGIVQSYYLGPGEARGTWSNRNHFANFEAMCLPFAVAYSISIWQKVSSGKTNKRPVLRIWGGFCIAVILLAAVIQSLSRMGFTAAILSIAVLAAFLTAVNLHEWRHTLHHKALTVTSAFLCVLVAAFLLAPPELIARFGKVEFSDGINTQDRLLLWHESLALLSAYPAFGTGLGAYESGFLTYKVTFPLVRDAFAHNDYLQYLIELGVVGFFLAAVSALAILWRTARLAIRQRGEERILAMACLGAFAALLLHSTVDFSLYIPANVLLLAWLAGIACSLASPVGFAEVIYTRASLSEGASRAASALGGPLGTIRARASKPDSRERQPSDNRTAKINQ